MLCRGGAVGCKFIQYLIVFMVYGLVFLILVHIHISCFFFSFYIFFIPPICLQMNWVRRLRKMFKIVGKRKKSG